MKSKKEVEQQGAIWLFMEALSTGNVGQAILNQEKQGQRDLVSQGSLIPVQGCNKPEFEQLGFKFIEQSDDLFWRVEMPNGWCIKETDHSMWTRLFDDKGRHRASIFYKAAFYDRSAHISLSRRYTYTTRPVGGWSENKEPNETRAMECVVSDSGQEIWRSEPMQPSDEIAWYCLSEHLGEKGKSWLSQHYPNWQDVLAYWNDENE